MPSQLDQDRSTAAGGAGRDGDKPPPLRDRETFLSRLVLSLSCRALDHPPSPQLREAVDRSNASVLGFLLQGVDLEAMPRPADERLAEALAPLRIKLDMIIDMVGKLFYRDIELPPLCDVELGLAQIAWQTRTPPHGGGWLRIELYFSPTFREPIVVFGKVTSCIEQGQDEACRIEADLLEIPGGIGENLARLALLTQRHQRARHPVRPVARREI
jgi:hypothetical protein